MVGSIGKATVSVWLAVLKSSTCWLWGRHPRLLIDTRFSANFQTWRLGWESTLSVYAYPDDHG
jgi:hypothetical protein